MSEAPPPGHVQPNLQIKRRAAIDAAAVGMTELSPRRIPALTFDPESRVFPPGRPYRAPGRDWSSRSLPRDASYAEKDSRSLSNQSSAALAEIHPRK